MSSRTFTTKLVFIGSPLIDICVKCSSDTLSKFGLRQDDCVKAVEKHDDMFQRLFNDPETQLSAGGSALNSARISKWVIADKGEVSFIGCAGEDTYERWLRKTLERDGILPLFAQVQAKSTGICACLVTKQGDRSMVTKLGAAAEISIEHLQLDHIKKPLVEAHCIFIVGYLLSHSPAVVYNIVNSCTEEQILSFSLSADYICKEYSNELQNVMPRINILMGNESEFVNFAKSLSGLESITVTESLNIISRIPKLSTRIVIVTCGTKPVIVDEGNDALKYFDVHTNIPVVDTVGCGDAFAGAFVATYTSTHCLSSSVKDGIKAATEVALIKSCNIPPKPFVS